MSKNTISILLAGFSAILIGVFAFVIIGGDGDSDESSSEPTTTTTTVPNNDSVAEGPYRKELLGLAQHFDLEPYGSDWNFSEVLGNTEKTLRVKTGKGIVSLYPGNVGSDDQNPCSGAPVNFLPLMASEGDIIVWDNTNNDFKICPGEIFVVATQEEVEALAED